MICVAICPGSSHNFTGRAGVCSHTDDYKARNKCLTTTILKQGYRYNKLRKAFSNFLRRHHKLVSNFNLFYIKANMNQNFMVT